MPFTSVLLDHTGQALWGPDWKGPMEAALQVDNRTMRRWLADPTSIPQGVENEIKQLCTDRIHQLTSILHHLGHRPPTSAGQ